jgi:hypothetical protein
LEEQLLLEQLARLRCWPVFNHGTVGQSVIAIGLRLHQRGEADGEQGGAVHGLAVC